MSSPHLMGLLLESIQDNIFNQLKCEDAVINAANKFKKTATFK